MVRRLFLPLVLMTICGVWGCQQRLETARRLDDCEFRCERAYFQCTARNRSNEAFVCTNANNECEATCQPNRG